MWDFLVVQNLIKNPCELHTINWEILLYASTAVVMTSSYNKQCQCFFSFFGLGRLDVGHWCIAALYCFNVTFKDHCFKVTSMLLLTVIFLYRLIQVESSAQNKNSFYSWSYLVTYFFETEITVLLLQRELSIEKRYCWVPVQISTYR